MFPFTDKTLFCFLLDGSICIRILNFGISDWSKHRGSFYKISLGFMHNPFIWNLKHMFDTYNWYYEI